MNTIVKKLIALSTPYYGNPEYWSYIPGFILFNHKRIQDNYVCGSTREAGTVLVTERHSSDVEAAITKYLTKQRKCGMV